MNKKLTPAHAAANEAKAILEEITAAHPGELPRQWSARLSARIGKPSPETICAAEATRLVLAGELVVAHDLESRLAAQNYAVTEMELLDPKSEPRSNGLPVVKVDGMAGALFSPSAVISFMDEWLAPSLKEEERLKADEQRALKTEGQAPSFLVCFTPMKNGAFAPARAGFPLLIVIPKAWDILKQNRFLEKTLKRKDLVA